MNISAALALSAHLLPGDWNAVHPAIRAEHGPVIAGAYLNSERRVSAFLGLTGGTDCWWEVGVVTGYTAGTVLPMARAGCKIQSGLHLFVAPAATVTGDAGAVLGIEIRH